MGMLTDIMCDQIERREGTILDRFQQQPIFKKENTMINLPPDDGHQYIAHHRDGRAYIMEWIDGDLTPTGARERHLMGIGFGSSDGVVAPILLPFLKDQQRGDIVRYTRVERETE